VQTCALPILCCSLILTANDFTTGYDISPLVGTAHLHLTIVIFPEVIKIITLYQLVSELRKGKTIIAFQSFFDRFFSHNIVDRDQFSKFTNKIYKFKIIKTNIVFNKLSI